MKAYCQKCFTPMGSDYHLTSDTNPYEILCESCRSEYCECAMPDIDEYHCFRCDKPVPEDYYNDDNDKYTSLHGNYND